MALSRVLWILLVLLPELIEGQSKKLACSYEHPRALNAGYRPDYIPVELCTHVIFKAFAFPRSVGRQMVFDDTDKAAFSQLVSAVRKRSNTVRVVASIDGSHYEYSIVSGVNVRRRAFVQAVGTLLLELDADAVEINWIQNGGYSPEKLSSYASDRMTKVILLQDLRQIVMAANKRLDGRNRELWFRGSIHQGVIDASYNVFDICDVVDHVTLEAMNIRFTMSHAPINGTVESSDRKGVPTRLDDTGSSITDGTIRWINDGCPQKKLLLGMAFFGIVKNYTHSSRTFFGPSYSTWGAFFKGIVSYRELCLSLSEPGWTIGWDKYGMMPYALRELPHGEDEIMSYDDVTSLRYKMDLVQDKRLGGVYVDYVHWDDIYARCGQAYPLTSYVAYRLQSIQSDIGFAIEWS
ncbi:endochitinase-like [Anopheles cruzii]|uniref:endochitinase-like n=1 Tax=Anopheles cruzii TaxID=68878 RepID=UPI0022EC6894|nr:endochitinase-like [Anopheles cruzii]